MLNKITNNIQLSHDIFVQYDHSGHITNANQNFYKHYGFNKVDDILQKQVLTLSWDHAHHNHKRIFDLHYCYNSNDTDIISIMNINNEIYLDYKQHKDNSIYSYSSSNWSPNTINPILFEYSQKSIKRYNIDILTFYNNSFLDKDISDTNQTLIFLLLAGYSQSEIANILNTSRSNIARRIGELLFYQFGLSECYSATILKDRLIHDGYQHFIPQNLSVNRPQQHGDININLLNENQKLIVEYLLLNYTQEEIAQKLNYSRSMIAKIILEQLCPIFNVNHSSTKALMLKLQKTNFS